MKKIIWILPVLSCVLGLAGCARFTGGAAYWKMSPDGTMVAKQAGFDTANLVQQDATPVDLVPQDTAQADPVRQNTAPADPARPNAAPGNVTV